MERSRKMKYLLDTNHCSYIQRKQPEVIKHVQNLPADAKLFTSVVTQGELLAGVALMKDEIGLKLNWKKTIQQTETVTTISQNSEWITSFQLHEYTDLRN
jgi:predicted nucleic acid-binding protein